jgi:hypothetical protein
MRDSKITNKKHIEGQEKKLKQIRILLFMGVGMALFFILIKEPVFGFIIFLASMYRVYHERRLITDKNYKQKHEDRKKTRLGVLESKFNEKRLFIVFILFLLISLLSIAFIIKFFEEGYYEGAILSLLFFLACTIANYSFYRFILKKFPDCNRKVFITLFFTIVAIVSLFGIMVAI